MRIVSFKRIEEFIVNHPDAEIPLSLWFHTAKNSLWDGPNDIKGAFLSADYLENDHYIFDIKNNEYCVVAIVIFASKKIYVRYVGTLQEYCNL